MSITEFKEKVSSDKEFAEKFKDVKTVEELIERAAKEGYEFTVEDVKNSVEINDEQLDDAAGGALFWAQGYFIVRDKKSLFFADGYYDSSFFAKGYADDFKNTPK